LGPPVVRAMKRGALILPPREAPGKGLYSPPTQGIRQPMPAPALISAIPLGARYMLASALAFALMGMCVRFAGGHGIPVLEIIAARAVVSLVLSYGDVRRRNIPLFGTHRLLLFSRGLVGFVSLTGVYYALVHL